MPIVRTAVTLFFAIGSPFIGYIFFKIARDALQTGRIRVRTGYFDRATRPKAFWFSVIYLSVFAFLCVFIAVLLVFTLLLELARGG
jgi:hypothetical protein